MKESIAIFVVFFFGLFIVPVQNQIIGITPQKLIGDSLENLKLLKQDCENELPRDQECALVYEYVPVKTKGE